jgi:hypothetical protein
MSDFDVDQALARLDRIQQLTDALAKARGDFAEQQDIAERIRRELSLAREALGPFANKIPL